MHSRFALLFWQKPQTLDQKAGIHRELGQRSWDEEGVAGGTGL